MKKISHNIRKVSKLEDNNLKFHSECNSKTKTKKKKPQTIEISYKRYEDQTKVFNMQQKKYQKVGNKRNDRGNILKHNR